MVNAVAALGWGGSQKKVKMSLTSHRLCTYNFAFSVDSSSRALQVKGCTDSVASAIFLDEAWIFSKDSKKSWQDDFAKSFVLHPGTKKYKYYIYFKIADIGLSWRISQLRSDIKNWKPPKQLCLDNKHAIDEVHEINFKIAYIIYSETIKLKRELLESIIIILQKA